MSSDLSQHSPAEVGSTLDSNKQESKSSTTVKQTKSAAESSKDTGPTSPATTTYELFVSNQRREIRKMEVSPARALSGGLTQEPFLLESTDSAAESPVKTCPSPETEQASPASAPDSSSTSPGSQINLFGMGDGSSLRTYPDSFPQTVAEISQSFSRRWPSSGFTTSPTESSTADTSESPKTGAEFSSLPDVLEDQVPERFYLSPKAAAGILKRSERRKRTLPQHLQAALTALASQHQDDDRGTT